MSAAKAQRGGAKGDAVEGNVVGLATDNASEPCSEIAGSGDAVARIAHGDIHSADFSSVGHDVKRKSECAAPDVFHLDVTKLREKGANAAAEDFSALGHGHLGFGIR